LSTYKTLAAALQNSVYDAAFICTPTSHHVEDLLLLLQHKVECIYIEKPVSHTTEGILQIISLAASYKNNIVVGYDLHFDPGIQKTFQLLQQNIIGNTVSVNAFVGQYLPQWRPYEDHRKGMSAKKETGGGVLLDLVHEFDYLCWLNGPVTTAAGFYTNSGALEIETEETAEVLLKFANNSIGTVHLDYLQQKLIRYCIITGTHGTVTCNLAEKNVSWVTASGNNGAFTYADFDRNERFMQIVHTFLTNPADHRLTSLQNAMQSLYIVEAAKISSETGCMVALHQYKN